MVFLPSRATFHITFLVYYCRGQGLAMTTSLKTVTMIEQGHVPYKHFQQCSVKAVKFYGINRTITMLWGICYWGYYCIDSFPLSPVNIFLRIGH